jgi:hypothetical protein
MIVQVIYNIFAQRNRAEIKFFCEPIKFLYARSFEISPARGKITAGKKILKFPEPLELNKYFYYQIN